MRKIGVSLIFILVVLFFGRAQAQEPGSLNMLDIASKSGNRVELVVAVLDKEGNPIKGLSQANFSLVVEGREIKNFTLEQVSSAKSPLSVILAMDVSGSMKGTPINEAKKASGIFLDQLEKDDFVALLTFGSSVKLLTDFTKKYVVRDKIAELAADEKWTWLYQASYDALDKAAKAPTSRAVVVLLTDGKDEGSPRSEADVLGRIKGTQIPIYTLGFGAQAQVDYLKRISTASGGYFLFTPSAEELSGLYNKVMDHLKNQYLLTFPFEFPGGTYLGTLKLNYRGQELDVQRRFLHARTEPVPLATPAAPVTPAGPAGVKSSKEEGPPPPPPVPWWKDPLVWGLVILGVGVLGAIILYLVFRKPRESGPIKRAKAAEPANFMVRGKLHSLTPPSGLTGASKDTQSLVTPGEVGFRIDMPPLPLFFSLIDQKSNRNYEDVIITRYDPDIKEQYAEDRLYLLLEDKTVSRPDGPRMGHARIIFDPETLRYKLEDLGSYSGTKLNDMTITEQVPLINGDVVMVGGVVLNFYDKRVFTETRV